MRIYERSSIPTISKIKMKHTTILVLLRELNPWKRYPKQATT